MNDQRTLLAAYVANGSESAFRELVARYIDLVYSTAVRLVNGDPIGRKMSRKRCLQTWLPGGTLAPDVMLGGWLHRRTWHVAATLMRHERRRQHRERQAVEMNAWQDKPEDQLERIAPLLDEAINQLGDHDRAAIVLRFFEHRDLRTIGELLGSNEDAAQKRVSRAVDKLRGHFARRGIVASATVFTSVLAAHAVHAAPVGLASTVTAASLAATTGSGVSSFASTLTQTLIMKKTTLVVLATIVAIGAVSISVVKIRHRGDTRGDGPVTAESLREGLVLDLPFDQDEADSGTITDKSGKANQGAATGVHWTADGQRGGAYSFRRRRRDCGQKQPLAEPQTNDARGLDQALHQGCHLAAYLRQILFQGLRPQHCGRMEGSSGTAGQPGDGARNAFLDDQDHGRRRAMALGGGHLRRDRTAALRGWQTGRPGVALEEPRPGGSH